MTREYVLKQRLAPSQIVSFALILLCVVASSIVPLLLRRDLGPSMVDVVFYVARAATGLIAIVYAFGLVKVLANGTASYELRDGAFKGYDYYDDTAYRTSGRLLFKVRKPILIDVAKAKLERDAALGANTLSDGRSIIILPSAGFDVIVKKFASGSEEEMLHDIREAGPLSDRAE